MRIRPPVLQLSAEDERLLALLDQLLSHSYPVGNCRNQDSNTVVLSDKEAAELSRHFERLLGSREFLESIYFVDQIFGRSKSHRQDLKSLFTTASKRKGRAANVLSTLKWHQFLMRLGLLRPNWPNDPQPMSFDHFLNMEQRLFKQLGLRARTCEQLLDVGSNGRERHEQLTKFDFTSIHGERLDRAHEPATLPFHRVKERVRVFADTIRRDVTSQQLAAWTTIVVDSSVMFTTRDWSVTSTISQMCGAIPLAIIK